MSRKQKTKTFVRKFAKMVASSHRICPFDAATRDSGVIRFGSGCAPAILRK